jgi:hypothetical protein
MTKMKNRKKRRKRKNPVIMMKKVTHMFKK